jgi:hypothetical protein
VNKKELAMLEMGSIVYEPPGAPHWEPDTGFWTLRSKLKSKLSHGEISIGEAVDCLLQFLKTSEIARGATLPLRAKIAWKHVEMILDEL